MTAPSTSRRNKSKAGYTITELIVVVLILALLGALVGPAVFRQFTGAQRQTAQTQLNNFAQALDQYRLEVGRYPEASAGLGALVQAPAGADNWNGPYLRRARDIPQDPWDNDYVYEVVDAGHVIISTYGADGREGGEGDDEDIVVEVF